VIEHSPSPWRIVEQAAQRAQVGRKTIYHEVKAGRLRAAKVGGRRELRFRDEWIDQWLEQTAQPQEIR
jgi:excisionase family DNA binding protein